MNNPLLGLQHFGQSVWLDYFHRSMIHSGELERLIREDGLRGLTSNPSIFRKAIANTDAYDGAIGNLARQGLRTPAIYQALVVDDLQRAADVFRPVYDLTGGQDGFVSLEVSPHLAHDTAGTQAEARTLWRALDRPNVMIKVPATSEGLGAIRRLTAEGVNVNVTLLFGLQRYQQVADAYLSGLEERKEAGMPADGIASVASFFLSRIDLLVDPMIERAAGPSSRPLAQVAIACARLAYHMFQETFTSSRFRRLEAGVQRLLWASTATKREGESDVKYVEPLIGPATINTMTRETLSAYRDHGEPAMRLTDPSLDPRTVLAEARALGVDLDQVAATLEKDGVRKFRDDFDTLLEDIERKRRQAMAA